MMKRTLLSILTLLCASISAMAQFEVKLEMEAKPKLHPVPEQYAGQSALVVQDRRLVQIKTEGEDLVVYRTMHRIIKVLDAKGIESFNKITLSAAGRELQSIKARSILPDGRVIDVPKDQIRQNKDEDGDPQYLFAMEGLEKNAEVELLVVEKRPFAVFGNESYQLSIPVLEAEFSLVAPERLKFETRGYNGFPKTTDTVIDMKRYYYARMTHVPGLEEEPYSNYNSYLRRVDYKLSFVLGQNTSFVRLFTWNDLAKELYKAYYNYSDKELKAVRKYLASIGVSNQDSGPQRIRKIEDALKTQIVVNEALDESFTRFDKIFEKKTTNEKGFVRLMAACMHAAGLEYEVGITSNRQNFILDEEFETWRYLTNYLFYFPEHKQYLAPAHMSYRYPMVPVSVLNNKAIFCRLTTIGSVTSAVSKVRVIKPLPMEESSSRIVADIALEGSELTPKLNITHAYTGYAALGMREAFVYLPQDKHKELLQNIISLSDKPEHYNSFKIQNAPLTNYYDNKPLELSTTVQAPQLMEKAGPKYLFKVGDVIGRQAEMYQDNKRELPIDMEYPHTLDRVITLTIPEGFKLVNPEALRFNQDHKSADGKTTMGFYSDYKLNGNKLTINVREFYDQTHYAVSDYEVFRKVINAAADFNKVVLVLQRN